ncbi:MAG: Metallo-beta-lactamase family protein, RNA-specific [Candidatus Saccharicenans subterraneus]|uniref:Metallo-beta-lactamase family protein, RNA-specific n=1 Tax=Candidatus Saccharicenans subterraneus TaxID=2508984 RepID=A0A3E2BN81_9BACT|nr:MAG: Metallo-beta-lactamase family protein, RNA-specific [Candidatus Saccharicenans subterraneum]
MKVKFLGAASQVTGSCFLLSANGLNFLVDCGLYQERDYQARNWEPFPFPPQKINYILLTHAHLDHCGLIPKVVREGFRGRILCTPPSAEILPIVLFDTAKLQEEDAQIKKKRHEKEGRRGPYPEIPLYTTADVEKALPLVEAVDYHLKVNLKSGVQATFREAGHILGSAIIELTVEGSQGEGPRKILFSGDLGQWNKPLVRDPETFEQADYIFLESTYGDREHDHPEKVADRLAENVNRVVSRGGNLVIPTFAIERAQELMFHLSQLVREKKIPQLPVFLDSPMAVSVTNVFGHYLKYLDDESRALFSSGQNPFEFPGLKLVQSFEESRLIEKTRGSAIIMAGSGMCTGGRIKQHLVNNISRPESTILFVGYQARGTLGRQILEGQSPVRIYGQMYQVRATVDQIQGFSAHADRAQLWKWLGSFQKTPRTVFLIHGEKEVIQHFAGEISEQTGWPLVIPEYLSEYQLD